MPFALGSCRLLVALLVTALALFAPPAIRADTNRAEKRFALVVTNQAYEKELIPLQYTHADGDIVAAALERTGFQVQVLRDGSKKAFLAALAEFEKRLAAAGPDGVGFFYFSGHCWANDTSNFIVLDERPSKDVRQMTRAERLAALPKIGITLKTVTDMVGRLASKASFVVIDSHLDIAEPTLIQDSLGRAKSDKPHPGLILAAQGRPGMPAADSNDFSKALAGALLTPGLSASEVFKQVQVKVAEVTNGRQVPWFEDQLLTIFRFTEPQPPAPKGEPAVPTGKPGITRASLGADIEAKLEDALWAGVVNTMDPTHYREYLAAYPQGRFIEPARQKLAALETKSTAAPHMPALPATGKRVALVVGNAIYDHEGKLKNPANDARAVATALRQLGFSEVREATNLNRTGLLAALRSFGELAEKSDWAMVYYSGHGIEVGGTNFLIPVDARLESADSAEDEAVSVDRLLSLTGSPHVVKVVILDACRSNAFPNKWSGRGATKGGRSKGFAPVKAESGTLIAFAAQPGSTASDGDGELNPYAEALVRHLPTAVDIRLMFGLVYDSMVERRELNQTPWYHAALSGRELVLKP